MPKLTPVPFVTEKADRLIDENKLHVFINTEATKPEISEEIESRFDVTVVKTNTMVTSTGDKKAIVTLSEDDDVADILSRIRVF